MSRIKLLVTVTRDSVCAGDDGDAPHEKIVEIDSGIDPESFVSALASGYLASVAGVGHSWEGMLNGRPIAVISVGGMEMKVDKLDFEKKNAVHFIYHSAKY